MGIALSEDHRTLADVVADFSAKHELLGAARALLEAPTEALPEVWGDLAEMGWLGLHLPEQCGGSGFGIEELVVVVGRARSGRDARSLPPFGDRERGDRDSG